VRSRVIRDCTVNPFDAFVARSLAVARGLGFAFLVYFVTALLRDVGGTLIPGAAILDAVTHGGTTGLLACLAVSAATMALAVLLVRLYSRTHGEADRPVPLLRLRAHWWREWARGLLIGAGLATLAVAPSIALGQVEILGPVRDLAGHAPRMLLIVLILALEAAREELGFRGPAQRELTRAVGFPIAAIFLAGSFAVIHAGNPAVGRAGMAGIFAAGLALAGLARARGDLGMVCGVHAAWNVALGMVWSVPVSGIRLHDRLLYTSSDTSIWTGGSFGAEASGPAIVVLFLFAFATWRLSPAVCPATEADAAAAEGHAAASPAGA
jgi:CAAX protease family protein